MKNSLKFRSAKVVSAVILVSMLFSFPGCHNKSEDILDGLERESECFWTSKDDKYASLISDLEALCSDCELPLSVMVATDTDVIFAAGLNSTETDGKTNVNPYTVYEMGSVTKTITAVAVFQLIEKGKLSLTDTLDRFWPEYEKAAEITVENLLYMKSGMLDYQLELDYGNGINDPSTMHDGNITDEQAVEAIFTQGCPFQAGKRATYCNTNYYLLALIVEKVSGKTYEDYTKTNIFDPCGMSRTTSCTKGNVTCPPDLSPYSKDELSMVRPFVDENYYMDCVHTARGCGGLHSCTADMVAFDRALMSGKLLSSGSLEKMMDFDTSSLSYGCGLYKQNWYFGHAGNTAAYNAMNAFADTEKYGRLYIVCMVPRSGTDADYFVAQIASILKR